MMVTVGDSVQENFAETKSSTDSLSSPGLSVDAEAITNKVPFICLNKIEPRGSLETTASFVT